MPVSDVASKDKKRQVKASFLSMDHTELRIHGGHGGLRNYGSTEHTEDTEDSGITDPRRTRRTQNYKQRRAESPMASIAQGTALRI